MIEWEWTLITQKEGIAFIISALRSDMYDVCPPIKVRHNSRIRRIVKDIFALEREIRDLKRKQQPVGL